MLLAALLWLPFLDRAFHIDDPYFLVMSESVGWNPVQAEATEQVYMGKRLEHTLPYELTHPVGLVWLLKLARGLVGDGERGLHLLFLVFPLMAAAGLVRLARALPGSSAGPLLLLLATAPAVLVSSHGLMADFPTFAGLVLAAGAYLGAAPRPRRRDLLLVAGGLTLAQLVSYQAGFLPALLALHAWRSGRLGPGLLLALAAPYLVLGAYLLGVYLEHGVFPLLASSLTEERVGLTFEVWAGLRPRALLDKALASLAVLGVNLGPVLVWCALGRGLPRGRTLARGGLALGLAWLALPLLAGPDGPVPGGLAALPAASMLALGVAVLVAAGRGARVLRAQGHGPLAGLLTWWGAAVLAYVLVVMPFGASRYLLPALPPLALLVLARRPARPVGAGHLVLGAVLVGLAWAAARADQEHAESYRALAERAAAELLPRDGDVWYVGEWGMRHYLDEAGARYLTAESLEPTSGDLVIAPELCRFWSPTWQVAERLELVETWSWGTEVEPSRTPLRLLSVRARAGFYASFAGLAPVAVSRAPHEVFSIYRVGPPGS